MAASVTQRLAEWVVSANLETVPAIGVERVRNAFLDSLGVQFAGMTQSTGKLIVQWIEAQGARQDCSIVASGVKTTAPFAALANATAGHALEFDDISTFSGHYANPLTAAVLAVGEKLGSSGKDAVLAWLVGWEVIAQCSRISLSPKGPDLIVRGWFNQGFAPALGVAALTSKLMGFDVDQTRMAIGHAASTMAGVMKNRGSDTKSFVAGNAAMHGIMAGELVKLGFTANKDIIDGEDGVAKLIGTQGMDIDPERVLLNMGKWDLATAGNTLRLHACCAAGHWSQDALLKILLRRPEIKAEEIEAIEVTIPEFLMPNMPYSDPQTGLEAKYSLQYDVAAIALNRKAGMQEYTDAKVQSPESRAMMKRIVVNALPGDMTTVEKGSRVVLKLKNGETLDEKVTASHGTPADPLTREEILAKFNDCAKDLTTSAQREKIIALCSTLENVANMREVAAAVAQG